MTLIIAWILITGFKLHWIWYIITLIIWIFQLYYNSE